MGIRNPGKGEFQKEKKKEKRGNGRNQDERNEGGGPGTPLPTWRLGFSREEATSSIKKEKEGEDERKLEIERGLEEDTPEERRFCNFFFSSFSTSKHILHRESWEN